MHAVCYDSGNYPWHSTTVACACATFVIICVQARCHPAGQVCHLIHPRACGLLAIASLGHRRHHGRLAPALVAGESWISLEMQACVVICQAGFTQTWHTAIAARPSGCCKVRHNEAAAAAAVLSLPLGLAPHQHHLNDHHRHRHAAPPHSTHL